MQEARLKVGGQGFEFLFRRLKEFYSPFRHVLGYIQLDILAFILHLSYARQPRSIEDAGASRRSAPGQRFRPVLMNMAGPSGLMPMAGASQAPAISPYTENPSRAFCAPRKTNPVHPLPGSRLIGPSTRHAVF